MPFSHMVRNMLAQRADPMKVETRIRLVPQADRQAEPVIAPVPELRWALDTLLDNAADYADRLICLDLSWTETHITLSVQDDGPGFKASMLAAAGQPGQTTRKGQNAHRGLGLFLVRAFMRQLGGQARFYNSQRGGAVVELRLPRQRLEAQKDPR
jgi:two-component system sensor histidine kinase RegB